MPVKKSVRLVDETIAIIANLSPGSETNWSRSINNMAEQFSLMINDNTPELTENEWNAFYCSQNGYMPHPEVQEEAKMLSWHISEGYQYDEQVRGFIGTEEQAIALIERIKSWSLSQRLAVIYKAKAFWCKGKVGAESSQ
jgi:hypothetical protein